MRLSFRQIQPLLLAVAIMCTASATATDSKKRADPRARAIPVAPVSPGCETCLRDDAGECTLDFGGGANRTACGCYREILSCLRNQCSFGEQERYEVYYQNAIRWVCSEPLYKRVPNIVPIPWGKCSWCLKDFPYVRTAESICNYLEQVPSCGCDLYWDDVDFITRVKRFYGCSQQPPTEDVMVQPAQVYLAGLTRSDLERVGLAVFIGRLEEDLKTAIEEYEEEYMVGEFAALEVVVADVNLKETGVVFEFDVEHKFKFSPPFRNLHESTSNGDMKNHIEDGDLQSKFLKKHSTNLAGSGVSPINTDKSKLESKKHSDRVHTSEKDNSGSGITPAESVAIGVSVLVAVGAVAVAVYYRYRRQRSSVEENRAVNVQNPLPETSSSSHEQRSTAV
eukprot:gb/GECG01007362.1/.p1 GENE.gb/GECG01007362.1/~~gb/GECG01007362.1/.p1  ORF type:complete len:394 (+),score=39.96 gb/GECG01007362.1/:1-1182(+)